MLKTALWSDWRELVRADGTGGEGPARGRGAAPTRVYPSPVLQPPEGAPTPNLRWTPLATVIAAASSSDASKGATFRAQASVSAAAPPRAAGEPPTLVLADASLGGRTVDAYVHSSLEAALTKAPAPALLRLGGLRAWAPAAGGPPRLVPTSAVIAVVDWDAPAFGAAAPASAVAAGSARAGAAAAGVVASVGPPELPGSAAAAASATGVARVLWLEDGEGSKSGSGDAATTTTTPVLLLDADAALGNLLAPGERMLLLAPTILPGGAGAPPALAPARGALVAAAPARSAGPGKENGACDSTPCPTNAGTQPARPRAAALAPGAARFALVGVATAARVSRGALCISLDDGGGASVELRMPLDAAPRPAWAVRPGDAVAAACACARVSTRGPVAVVEPLQTLAVQSLPRLPALLASPTLAAAAGGRLADAAARGGAARARAVCGAAVALRRVHTACGRPLVPAVMCDDEMPDPGGGVVRVVEAAHAAACRAAAPSLPPAPAAPDCPLWSCSFCGVDCTPTNAALGLELGLCLVEGGEGADASAPVAAVARGDAAAALLGLGPLDFAALGDADAAAAAAAVAGRAAHVALVPPPEGSTVAEVACAIVDEDE